MHYFRREAGRNRRELNKGVDKEKGAEESKCKVGNYLLGRMQQRTFIALEDRSLTFHPDTGELIPPPA